MHIYPELLSSLALGLALSACCGFRVFVPMLVASIAARMGWLPPADHFAWLSTIPAIVCFATASVVEVMAYYIPVVDNVLDAIATPSAVIAGTLLSASTLVHMDSSWQWILGIIIGGGSAGIIQAGSVLTRAGTTKATVGTGNHILATGELAAALSGSVLALVFPVLMAAGILLLLAVIVSIAIRMLRRDRRKARDKPW